MALGVPRKTRLFCAPYLLSQWATVNMRLSHARPPTPAPALFVIIKIYRYHVWWGAPSDLSAPFHLPWKRKFPWSSVFIGNRTGTARWPKTIGRSEDDSPQWSLGTQLNEMGASGSPGQHSRLAMWPVSLVSSYLSIERRGSAFVLEHFKYMWGGGDLSSR